MPILNELQNYSILNIFKHLFQKALKVLYVYFNIYLHYITDLGGQVFLLTDFVFCFIVFPNTFAEALCCTVDITRALELPIIQ